MEVNNLESREVLVVLFGMPIMVTLIVLVSIGVGHWVTTRSDRPTNVSVSAATPKIDVNVPAAQTPSVQVAASVPNVDVHVPAQSAPVVNVSAPPAVVTVLDRRAEGDARLAADEKQARKTETAKSASAKDSVNAPPPAAPVFEPAKNSPAPELKLPAAKNDVPRASAAPAANALAAAPVSLHDEDLSLETLYTYAEKYIDSYCAKNALNAADEARRWNLKWKRGMEQAVNDKTDTDEQSYINRIVVSKRECFDIEKATPEKIVEGCRIMLRYRDGKFAWLKAMRDAVTNENLKKTLVFLAAGVR